MQILLFSLVVGFCCGLIGSIYRNILAYEPILNWWFRFGDRYFCSTWLYKPIWVCSKCFAGQLAGWFWLLFSILPRITNHYRQIVANFSFMRKCIENGGALILGWFCAICTAILMAVILHPLTSEK